MMRCRVSERKIDIRHVIARDGMILPHKLSVTEHDLTAESSLTIKFYYGIGISFTLHLILKNTLTDVYMHSLQDLVRIFF